MWALALLAAQCGGFFLLLGVGAAVLAVSVVAERRPLAQLYSVGACRWLHIVHHADQPPRVSTVPMAGASLFIVVAGTMSALAYTAVFAWAAL